MVWGKWYIGVTFIYFWEMVKHIEGEDKLCLCVCVFVADHAGAG